MKKQRNVTEISLAFATAIVFVCFFALTVYSKSTVASIAEKTMRVQVIAESNSKYDQQMKLVVKNAVSGELEKLCKDCNNKDEYMAVVLQNKAEIKSAAQRACDYCGYNKEINVSVGRLFFPEKENGEYMFPAGKYDALRVEIGRAQGHNWWNLLYPPQYDGNDAVTCEDVLDKSEYSIVKKDGGVKIRFALVQWIEEKTK